MKRVDRPKASVGPQRNILYVPWGYYYYGFLYELNLDGVYTDSIASCFAVVCHHTPSGKLFFAHVSQDAETESIVEAIRIIQPQADEYVLGIMTGKRPTDPTNERIKWIIEAAGNNGYPFPVYTDPPRKNSIYLWKLTKMAYLEEGTTCEYLDPISKKDKGLKIMDKNHGLLPILYNGSNCQILNGSTEDGSPTNKKGWILKSKILKSGRARSYSGDF